MHEADAMNVIAVRALEGSDAARMLVSETDRSWASRAAAEVVGADATPEVFLARRAALTLERLGERHAVLPRALRALRWRAWVGSVIVVAAFVLGAFLDQIGGAKRISILAPPVLGVILWNLVVYVIFLGGTVAHLGAPARRGRLTAAIQRWASGLAKPRGSGGLREAIVALGNEWAQRSAALNRVRAIRILHLAAAMLAAGILAGLYLRGLVLEYQASWESTFLSAAWVQRIAALIYWPGAALTGVPVPSVQAIAAIHAPGSENAARWLHLIAATTGSVVIVPRLLLALGAWCVERHRATHFSLPLDEPYFQKLLRGYRGGPARVRVLPYSYQLAPDAQSGLEAIVARSFGGSASVLVAPPLAYGATEAFPVDMACSTLMAVFNATATPERETHGAFLSRLATLRGRAEAVLAIVDEGPWRAHFTGDTPSLEERRAAWQTLAAEAGARVVFTVLAAPDLAAVDAALDAAIGDHDLP